MMRAQLWVEKGDVKRGVTELERMAGERKGDVFLAAELARVSQQKALCCNLLLLPHLACPPLLQTYHKTGQPDKAIAFLHSRLGGDATSDPSLVWRVGDGGEGEQGWLTLVNMLAELQMEGGDFEAALATVERVRGRGGGAERELPLELDVKAGMCHAYLGHPEKAQVWV